VSLPSHSRVAALPVLRAVVFVAALIPALRLVLWPVFDLAGANPVEFVTRSSGTWALALLCATLAMTPLRRLTGWPHWLRLRRMLGLFTFFYASLHLATWVWLDQWFDPKAMLLELLERPYLTVGALAFLLMLPLALTSSDAMIRRLGRRWGLLHRLIHPVALLAILHFAWHKSAKNDYAEVAAYAAVIAILLMLRLVWRLAARRRTTV
jgi:sulfoxide reductase heme-binding subunit YedZ